MPTHWPKTLPGDLPYILIAAQSGRALAAAARRAGYAPLVADLFGDADTMMLAAGYRRLKGRLGLGLGEGDVLPVLESLAAQAGGKLEGLVLGSGFERNTRLMAMLERRFCLIGASAATVRLLKDPLAFAALLARLGIPHPDVVIGELPASGVFLSKRRGGSGGSHIRIARPGPQPGGRYAQRCVRGEPHAVAFLADGRCAQILAVTQQWTAPSRQAPWRYGGAVEPGACEPPLLPVDLRATLGTAITAIVEATGLRGLASADFLFDGKDWWLLEINPRPGGTLDILDCRPTPLLRRHCAAAAGQIGAHEEPPTSSRGNKILYAPRAMMAESLTWPGFVADRPPAGTLIPAGGPICTIAAEARNTGTVRSLLDARCAELLERILHKRDEPRDWLLDSPERQRAGEAAR